MTREDLIRQYREKHSLTHEEAKTQIDNVINLIADNLIDGNAVPLAPIGSFIIKPTAERKGRNPKTGEALTIPASRVVRFNAYPAFKESIKSSK